MNKIHKPDDGRCFTARELAELLLTQPDNHVQVRVDLDGDVVVGGRLHAVKFDGFYQRWELAGPDVPREVFGPWIDSFGNQTDVLASVNAALRSAGIDKRIDCVNGQAVVVPVPEIHSELMEQQSDRPRDVPQRDPESERQD